MHKNNHKIIPDRIEAGTFIICAAGLGSGIKTENIELSGFKTTID